MRTNLYFVRHAHSVYSQDELTRPLSERGFSDAKKVIEILQQSNIDHVISSPYKRAFQTVEGIAKYIGEEIIIEEDYKERVLSERPVDDFISQCGKIIIFRLKAENRMKMPKSEGETNSIGLGQVQY